MIAPNKVSGKEIVDSLLIRTKDKLGINRADYTSYLKDIWKKLNLKGIKESKRILIRVNRKNNSVEVPDDYFQFSTIYVFDDCGKIVPLAINTNLSEEIVDLSRQKGCDCGCDLCAQVSNYEAIEEVVPATMPNSSVEYFTKRIVKKVNADGSYIQEITEPQQIFLNGAHTETKLVTSSEYICKLDVADNGCVLDTEENKTKIYGQCGFVDLRHECGCPTLPDECNGAAQYNISDDGKRIILPSNYQHDYIILRYYFDKKTKDIEFPWVSKSLVMDEMYWAHIEYDPKVPRYVKIDIKNSIAQKLQTMLSDITRMTMSEMYKMVSPKKHL